MVGESKEEASESKKRPREEEVEKEDNNGCHETKKNNGAKSTNVGDGTNGVDGTGDDNKDESEVKSTPGDDEGCPVAKKARHSDGNESTPANNPSLNGKTTETDKEENQVNPSENSTEDTSNGADVKEEKEQPKPVFGSSVPFSGFTGLKSQPSTASATSDSVDTTKSVFGSASSVSVGFGFSSSASSSAVGGDKGTAGDSTNTGSNGSIFGRSISASSSGFGSTTSIFGSKETGNGTTSSIFGSFVPSPSSSKKEHTTQSKSALPQPSKPITNGEENEEATFTMRAKLYKLQKIEDTPPPPSVNLASTEEKKETGIKCATKVGNDATTVNSSENDQNSATTAALKMEWKEVGIGPLKILISCSNKTTARIVQRRESTPGGPGTKLILNVMLRHECIVEKRGDKFVKLAAFEVVEDKDEDTEQEVNNKEGTETETQAETENVKKKMKLETVQYLFKVKTVGDADSLLGALKQYCK